MALHSSPEPSPGGVPPETTGGDRSASPRVKGSPAHAERELQRQIEKGKKLVVDLGRIRESMPPGRRQTAMLYDSPDLQALQREKRNWSRYGLTLLGEIFTTSQFSEEYTAKATQPRYGHPGIPSFDAEVHGLGQELQGELELLRSYLERLPLLGSSHAESSMNEKAWVRWLNIAGSVASVTGLSLLALNKAIASIPFGEILGWLVAGMLFLALIAFLLAVLQAVAGFFHRKFESRLLLAALWLAGLAGSCVVTLWSYQGARVVVVEFVKHLMKASSP